MKFRKVLLLLFIIVLVSGCSSKLEEVPTENFENIVSSEVNVGGTGKLTCTRDAVAGEGIDVDLRYMINYKNGYIQELHAIEKVTSNDQNSLDEYENAYKKISSYYEGLKYYDTSVIRDSNSVTNNTVINYEKIDMDKLLEIEGEEDNVIENGKVKLSTWLGFASKLGTTCEEA